MTGGSWLAWDHNTYYHDRLLRALPGHCERVLDVGCGTGAFAARLATMAGAGPQHPSRGQRASAAVVAL